MVLFGDSFPVNPLICVDQDLLRVLVSFVTSITSLLSVDSSLRLGAEKKRIIQVIPNSRALCQLHTAVM